MRLPLWGGRCAGRGRPLRRPPSRRARRRSSRRRLQSRLQRWSQRRCLLLGSIRSRARLPLHNLNALAALRHLSTPENTGSASRTGSRVFAASSSAAFHARDPAPSQKEAAPPAPAPTQPSKTETPPPKAEVAPPAPPPAKPSEPAPPQATVEPAPPPRAEPPENAAVPPKAPAPPPQVEPAPQPKAPKSAPPPAPPALQHVVLAFERKTGRPCPRPRVLPAEGGLSIEGVPLQAGPEGLTADLPARRCEEGRGRCLPEETPQAVRLREPQERGGAPSSWLWTLSTRGPRTLRSRSVTRQATPFAAAI